MDFCCIPGNAGWEYNDHCSGHGFDCRISSVGCAVRKLDQSGSGGYWFAGSIVGSDDRLSDNGDSGKYLYADWYYPVDCAFGKERNSDCGVCPWFPRWGEFDPWCGIWSGTCSSATDLNDIICFRFGSNAVAVCYRCRCGKSYRTGGCSGIRYGNEYVAGYGLCT